MPVPPWLLLISPPGSAAFNMSLDEALLESMPRLGQPVLRFYAWTEPAASFGYFQKYREIERLTPLRPLVRRPTGGGLVPHDSDWTYSIIIPTVHEWYDLPAIESYRRTHLWIQAAFARLGVESRLAPESRKDRTGQCFVGFEQFDLIFEGRKIAGAAQRRSRDGLLIQGSVHSPFPALARTQWHEAMRQAGLDLFSVHWTAFPTDPRLENRVLELSQQKYSQLAYNRRR